MRAGRFLILLGTFATITGFARESKWTPSTAIHHYIVDEISSSPDKQDCPEFGVYQGSEVITVNLDNALLVKIGARETTWYFSQYVEHPTKFGFRHGDSSDAFAGLGDYYSFIFDWEKMELSLHEQLPPDRLEPRVYSTQIHKCDVRLKRKNERAQKLSSGSRIRK